MFLGAHAWDTGNVVPNTKHFPDGGVHLNNNLGVQGLRTTIVNYVVSHAFSVCPPGPHTDPDYSPQNPEYSFNFVFILFPRIIFMCKKGTKNRYDLTITSQ